MKNSPNKMLKLKFSVLTMSFQSKETDWVGRVSLSKVQAVNL